MLVSEVVFWFLLTENLMPLSVPYHESQDTGMLMPANTSQDEKA